MSNIDFTKLRKAADIAAEQAKDAAKEAERSALRATVLAGPPSNSVASVVARLDAIERLLGLKPLRAEG
jgi:hypothetical protein